jgi:hypothetical protein
MGHPPALRPGRRFSLRSDAGATYPGLLVSDLPGLIVSDLLYPSYMIVRRAAP